MNAPTIALSDFVRKQNSRTSGNSYCLMAERFIPALVQEHWDNKRPGTGETGLDRKVLVNVPPESFYCPPRARLVPGLPLKAESVVRQEGEDPYIEVYVEQEDAERFGVLELIPAGNVDVVCYSAEALLENNGQRSSDADWEIVTYLCTEGGNEPMQPLAMARNFLEKPGGTKGVYTAEEFAESIYYWATKRGVKVRLRE